MAALALLWHQYGNNGNGYLAIGRNGILKSQNIRIPYAMSAAMKSLIYKNIGCRNIFKFTSTSRNKRYTRIVWPDDLIECLILSFRCDRLGACNIVKPGNVSTELLVPDHIVKPDYYYEFTPPGSAEGTSRPEIKTSQDIEQMRETCKLAANILKSCHSIIKVRQ